MNIMTCAQLSEHAAFEPLRVALVTLVRAAVFFR